MKTLLVPLIDSLQKRFRQILEQQYTLAVLHQQSLDFALQRPINANHLLFSLTIFSQSKQAHKYVNANGDTCK